MYAWNETKSWDYLEKRLSGYFISHDNGSIFLLVISTAPSMYAYRVNAPSDVNVTLTVADGSVYIYAYVGCNSVYLCTTWPRLIDFPRLNLPVQLATRPTLARGCFPLKALSSSWSILPPRLFRCTFLP